MADKLTPEELDNAIKALDGWQRVDGRDAIAKTFKFADFNQAFGFMTLVAAKAEAMYDPDTIGPGDLAADTGGPNSDGWHHLAVTHTGSGGTAALYIDGVEDVFGREYAHDIVHGPLVHWEAGMRVLGIDL